MNVQDLIEAEVKDLLEDLDENVRPVVQQSIKRIGVYMQVGVETGDWLRAQKNIAFEKSVLASQGSVATTEVQIRVKRATETAFGWLLDQALSALD